MELLSKDIDCPYCGEVIEILIDDSAGEQDYYEDCFVCCRPIRILQSNNPVTGECEIQILRDDD